MKVEYSRRAEKELDAMHEPVQSRIRNGVNMLPYGDVKKLAGTKRDMYRLRIGNYRIIFERQEQQDKIVVTGITTRGQAYKKGA